MLKSSIDETTLKLTTSTETLALRVSEHKTRETQLSCEVSAGVEREKTLLLRIEEYGQLEMQYNLKEGKLITKISELETQLQNKTSVMNNLLEKSAAINSSITELTSVKDREINGLKQRVSDLDSRLTNALTENDKLSKDNSEVTHDLQNQVTALVQSLQNTTTTLKALQAQHAHLQQQHSDYIANSTHELSAANDRVTLTIDTLSRKAGEVRALQEECDSLRAQLRGSRLDVLSEHNDLTAAGITASSATSDDERANVEG